MVRPRQLSNKDPTESWQMYIYISKLIYANYFTTMHYANTKRKQEST